jgi:hypothetical protein
MMDKLKKTAVLLGGVMLILLIIVWGIKHNMKPLDVQQEADTEPKGVTEEPEEKTEVQVDYDIAAGLKLKDKDGIKTLSTDHFTLKLTHGKSWDVKVNSKTSITIYNKALYEGNCGGKLVTILAYDAGDESYDVLPEYNVIGKSGGKVYIAAYPTDMQYDSSNRKAVADYLAVFEEVSRLMEDASDCPLIFR